MGKNFFQNLPSEASDAFHEAFVTPVIHYRKGGTKFNEETERFGAGDRVIDGLYSVGEAAGGIHGFNRPGGKLLHADRKSKASQVFLRRHSM